MKQFFFFCKRGGHYTYEGAQRGTGPTVDVAKNSILLNITKGLPLYLNNWEP